MEVEMDWGDPIRVATAAISALAGLAALFTNGAFEERVKPLTNWLRGTPFGTYKVKWWGILLIVVIIAAPTFQYIDDEAKSRDASKALRAQLGSVRQDVEKKLDLDIKSRLTTAGNEIVSQTREAERQALTDMKLELVKDLDLIRGSEHVDAVAQLVSQWRLSTKFHAQLTGQESAVYDLSTGTPQVLAAWLSRVRTYYGVSGGRPARADDVAVIPVGCWVTQPPTESKWVAGHPSFINETSDDSSPPPHEYFPFPHAGIPQVTNFLKRFEVVEVEPSDEATKSLIPSETTETDAAKFLRPHYLSIGSQISQTQEFHLTVSPTADSSYHVIVVFEKASKEPISIGIVGLAVVGGPFGATDWIDLFTKRISFHFGDKDNGVSKALQKLVLYHLSLSEAGTQFPAFMLNVNVGPAYEPDYLTPSNDGNISISNGFLWVNDADYRTLGKVSNNYPGPRIKEFSPPKKPEL
jgi:hypothetical protein